jgi:transposase InsO family protein
MRRHGIRAAKPRSFRVCTTDSNHGLPVAPNLLDRNFSAEMPNRVWLADITCIPTDEGWLYLAVSLPFFFIAWSLSGGEWPESLTLRAALNGEDLDGRFLAGGAMILAGLAVYQWGRLALVRKAG